MREITTKNKLVANQQRKKQTRKKAKVYVPSPASPSTAGGARLANFFLMVPQVLEAVLVVLKSAATLSFSRSMSGGDLRQSHAALRTRSSFSVKSDFSGEAALGGDEDMLSVGLGWVLVGEGY